MNCRKIVRTSLDVSEIQLKDEEKTQKNASDEIPASADDSESLHADGLLKHGG